MARIRTIKPEFPQSESMGNVSRDARLLFLQLWTICDDSGRCRAASRMLASLLFPYDDDAPSLIRGWLDELDREGCIRLYEVCGSRYLQVVNWLKHQKIDKPSKPLFPAEDDGSRVFASIRECSSLDQGSRTKDQGPRIKDQGMEKEVASGCAGTPPALQSHVEHAEELDLRADDDEPPELPRGKLGKQESKSGATFAAYAEAYRRIYGTDPVRNRQTNAQLCAFIDRVGAEEAPQIAAFFLTHPNAYYRSRGHSVGCLLSDAEKLRTEWATKRVTTAVTARQQERTASNPFVKIAADLRREEQQDAQA